MKRWNRTLPPLLALAATLAACSREKAAPPVDDVARDTVFAITIETENAVPVTSKEDYVNCQVTVDGKGIHAGYSGSARVRGRGNSTWSWYPKKPYRLKLDKKSGILGLESDRDWVLLANYRDPTRLMNAVAFEAAACMGLPYTNHTRLAEVTLNGDYIGLYQLTEQVETGENRVNISETDDYLLSLDLDDGPGLNPAGGDNFWSLVFNMPVCVKSPEDQAPRQLEAIKTDLALLENAINDHDHDRAGQLLDLNSLVDFLLLEELVYNVELAAPRSVYMHKVKGGKYVMGPAWDFDAGFDFDWSTMYTGHDYFASYRELVLGTDPARQVGGYNVPGFFTRMFLDPAFVARYKARWREVRDDLLERLLAYIDATAAYAAGAMARDLARWPVDKNPATEIARLKQWLQERTTYLTTVIENIPDR